MWATALLIVAGAALARAAGPLEVEWSTCFPTADDQPQAAAASGQAVVPAPDGSGVFVIGTADNDATATGDFLLAKYAPDGRLDPAFGGGAGWVGYHRQDRDEDGALVDLDLEARALAVDAGGNVYVTGLILGDALAGSVDVLTVKFAPDGRVVWADAFNKDLGAANAGDYGDEDVRAIVVDRPLGELEVIGTVTGDGNEKSNVLVLRYPLGTTSPARDRRKKELHLGGDELGAAAAVGAAGELYVAAARPGRTAPGGYAFLPTPACPGTRYYPEQGGYAHNVPWVPIEGTDVVLTKYLPGTVAPSWTRVHNLNDGAWTFSLWAPTGFATGPDGDVLFDCSGYIPVAFEARTLTAHGSDDLPLAVALGPGGDPVVKVGVFDGTDATAVARFSALSGAPLGPPGARLGGRGTSAGLVVDAGGNALVASSGPGLMLSRVLSDGTPDRGFGSGGVLGVPVEDGSIAVDGAAIYVTGATGDLCTTKLSPPGSRPATTTTTLPRPVTTTLPPVVSTTTTLPPVVPTTTLPPVVPTTTLPPVVPTTTLPPVQSTTTTVPAPVESTTTLPPVVPTTTLPAIQSTTTVPAPVESTTTLPPVVPTTTLPPVESTTTVPAPAESTTTLPPVPTTTLPPPRLSVTRIEQLGAALEAATGTEITPAAASSVRRVLGGVARLLSRVEILRSNGRLPAARRMASRAALRLTGEQEGIAHWGPGQLPVRLSRYVAAGTMTAGLQARLERMARELAAHIEASAP